MPKAVSCQHPWLASSPHSHSHCLEGSLLSGTWKARSLAPELVSAPATPLRGSKAIYFLSPLERRTGSPPEPALQVQQSRLLPLPAGSRESLLPTPAGPGTGTAAGPRAAPTPQNAAWGQPSLRSFAWSWPRCPVAPWALVPLYLPSQGSPGAPHMPKSSMCLNVVIVKFWGIICIISVHHIKFYFENMTH